MQGIRIVFLLSCFSATALLSGQEPAPPAPAVTATAPADSGQFVPTLHVTSRLVILDAVVTDGHGRSIKGLKASDFALFEEGSRQTIVSFVEHDEAADTPVAKDAAERLPANTFAVQPRLTGDRPRTVIVLGSLSFENAPQVRYELKKFMKTVPAGMPIAIFRGDWKGIHLVQDFTTDPEVLLEAASSQRILPPLGDAPVSKMRPPDPRGLARYLASIPGRINLIWISDGGAPMGQISNSFPDVSNFIRDANGATNVLRLSRIAIYAIDGSGVQLPFADMANFDGAAPMPSMGGSVFGQDPGHLFANVDLADAVAATGGRAFSNRNDYAQAIAEVVKTGSHYYTISYRPTNSNWNGALRTIKIEVPKGIIQAQESGSEKFEDAMEVAQVPRVEYRNSYRARDSSNAPQGGAALAALAAPRKLLSDSRVAGRMSTAIQEAIGLGASAPDDIHFKIVATASPQSEKLESRALLPRGNFLTTAWRDKPYRNVLLHYSINPEDLRFTLSENMYSDALEFVAVLYRDDGVVVNSFKRTASLSGDDGWYSEIMSAPLALDQTIAIPVDGDDTHYLLRTAVEEVPTDRVGAIEIPAEWIKLPPAQDLAASR